MNDACYDRKAATNTHTEREREGGEVEVLAADIHHNQNRLLHIENMSGKPSLLLL